MSRHAIIEADLRSICESDLPWPAFQGKTVVVSGANGFLPAYMVETLLYLNETRSGQQTSVIGLVRSLERATRRFEAYRGRKDLQLIVHDVTQPLPPMARADFIVHAASPASPKYFGSDPVGTLAANVLGTHHLLTLARDCRAEALLLFSSGEVYGQPVQPCEQVCERDQGIVDHLQVRSCYAESKRMAETMCVCWQYQFQVPAKIVRISHTYGPGMRLDDGRVFADFVADVVHRRPIVMKSDGAARRPFCYIADAAKAFFAVLLKGKPGEAYNVANDQEECSVLELAQMLVGLFPERHLHVVRQARSAGDTYLPCSVQPPRPDVTKVKALGWSPGIDLREGFRRTVQSFE